MANQLSLTIGQTTISVPINLTAQQARAVISRYATQTGIDTEGRTGRNCRGCAALAQEICL
jgi:hypothetical protein